MTLYEQIDRLCLAKGVSITRMCNDTGVNRSSLGDLKRGKIKKLNAQNMNIIAEYFGVTTDALLGKAPIEEEKSANYHAMALIMDKCIDSAEYCEICTELCGIEEKKLIAVKAFLEALK